MNTHSSIARPTVGRLQPARSVASLVLATSVCLACGAGPGCEEAPEPRALEFELLAKSGLALQPAAASNAQSTAYRVFDDAASWSRFWQHAFPDSVPSVDFESEFVLCVYQGMKSTGGYEIAVRDIQLAGKSLRVALDLREPRPGDMLIQVVTDPYAMYKVRLPHGVRATPGSGEQRIDFVVGRGDAESKIEVRRLASP